MCRITEQINSRARQNTQRIMNEAKIRDMGETCRKLFDAGANLNMGEALLFLNSLRMGDASQCEALIKTLKERAKK